MRRQLSIAVAVAVLLLGAWPHHAVARSTNPDTLLSRADDAFKALRVNARAQRLRHNFTRVLEAYRKVFEGYPGTRQSELALLRSGELMTLLYRWTGQESDLNRAQNYYQRLIQNSPKSPYYDDALLAIAYIYRDHFKDPAQAWLRFGDVVKLAPRGNKAAEARRQLKRLARYAPASEPAAATASSAAPTKSPSPTSTTVPILPSAPAPIQPAARFTPGSSLNRVRGIRHWSNPEYSRVVIDLDQETNFYSNLLEDRSDGGKPPRLYIDLFNSIVEERLCQPIAVNDGILLGIRAGQNTLESVRVVLEIDALLTYRVFPMRDPFRIVIDVTGGAALSTSATTSGTEVPPTAQFVPAKVPELRALPTPSSSSAAPATVPPATAPPAAPTSPVAVAPKPTPPASGSGKPSLARQLGLGIRRVVIDAGHGAHDPGAIGIDGIQEKDVTLDVALRVRDLLQGARYETVLTRDRDFYLPLEERTALANTSRGDLFLSLHCNSSDAGNLEGVETYFLNLASNLRSMKTAARENSMAIANMSDLQQIVREIQNSKMDESSQFAAMIQKSLHGALHRKHPGVKDLGVKQAPFYVLIGAQMPSVLVEVSFINHPTEGKRLASPEYRQIIAQAIADGVTRYVKSIKTADLSLPVRANP